MDKRFSKKGVAEWARGRIDRLAENYRFDLGTGWAQVDNSTTRNRLLERNRAYGEVMALQALCDAFNLMEVKLED